MQSSNSTSAFNNAPIRALLLDDSSFDRARIRRLSRQAQLNIAIDEVDSLNELEGVVDHGHYDLFLIDYRLPVGNGIEAMALLRKNPRHKSAGNIMITGHPKIDTAVQAMRCGYHDVLSKNGMTANDLRTSVKCALEAARQEAPAASVVTKQQLQDSISSAVNDPTAHEFIRLMGSGNEVGGQNADLRLGNHRDISGLLNDMLQTDEFVFEPRKKQ